MMLAKGLEGFNAAIIRLRNERDVRETPSTKTNHVCGAEIVACMRVEQCPPLTLTIINASTSPALSGVGCQWATDVFSPNVNILKNT